jgi:hypothetical protein
MVRWISALISTVIISATIPAQKLPITTQRGRATLRGSVSTEPLLVRGAVIRVKYSDIRLARASWPTKPVSTLCPDCLLDAFTVTAELTGFVTTSKPIEITSVQENYTIDFVLSMVLTRSGRGVSADREPGQVTQAEAEERSRRATLFVESLWGFSLRGVGSQPLRNVPGFGFNTVENMHSLGAEYVVPALSLGLEDPDAQMRLNSAHVLMDLASGISVSSKMDCRAAFPALMRAVSDPDPEVRSLATEALKKIREFPMTLIK